MEQAVGFAGLGAMGGGMARRLLGAGMPLAAYDPNPDAQAALERSGAATAAGIGDIVETCRIVHTSLPSPEVFVAVYEREVLPRARAGQVFIDHTTAQVTDVRRLSEALAERGAALLDAPVSGGPGGAKAGTLRVFVGGDPSVLASVQAHFDALGDNVTHCGPSGAGQLAKIVNQLGMGLSNAVLLEALAVAVRGGVDPLVLAKAVGSEGEGGEPWRRQLFKLAQDVAVGKAEWVSVKEAQLDDFLADAEAVGQPMPMTAAVAQACRRQEKVVREANRMAASYWRVLSTEAEKPLEIG